VNQFNYESSLNNTDKFSGGFLNDGSYGHNYQLLYKNFINDKVKSILEIGTANGGFGKFLHDNGLQSIKLVGADISPNDKHYHVSDHTNYNYLYNYFFTGNAFSEDFFTWNQSLNMKYDFIVEDADHVYETQSYMLKNCFRLLNPNGVYICEDVNNYIIAKQLMRSVPDEYKPYAYIWDGTDSIHRKDDICIVIDLR